MKKVTRKKRKFNYKDITRILLTSLIHYLIFAAYTAVVITINYLVNDNWFFSNMQGLDYTILYFLIAAPGVNAILHLTFEELGSPWMRLAMWLHSTLMIVLIPIAIMLY